MFHRSLKKVAVTAMAALTAVSLAACAHEDSAAPQASGSKDSGTTASGKPVRVWFMEGSVSDDAQKWLTQEFAKENPGQTLQVEVQPWQNIAAKLQTALASKDQSPDVVEIGTGRSLLAASGALLDISDMYKELGGSELIPDFTDGGMYNGKHYAYPMYGGVRGVFYRKDLFKKAGIEVPKTLDEFKDAAIKLQKANPDHTPDFSGVYLAGVDFHALESYMYAMGGRYAKEENGKFVGTLTSPEAQKALHQIQDIFRNGTHFALDSKAGQKQFQNYFSEGKVGMLIATGNLGNLIDKKLFDEGKVGVFALPSETPGKYGVTYAGGSNVAISANSQNVPGAKAAMKLIFSKGFQERLAASGWVPGNLTYADHVAGKFSDISKGVMKIAYSVPKTPKFDTFYQNNGLANFWASIAKLEDPMAAAKQLDDQFNKVLNSDE